MSFLRNFSANIWANSKKRPHYKVRSFNDHFKVGDNMEYRLLGNTGIKVSRICFGALTIGPLQANLSVTKGADLIRYALELGINFIDTAKLYGTYPYIKKALSNWPGEVVIASKSYDYTKEGMKISLDEARRELDRDYIDIFLLHEQESELTLEGHRPALEYLWNAKAKGMVRAVGISTHSASLIKHAASHDDVEIIHPIVNYRGLGLLDGTAAQVVENIEIAARKGKGIYAMKPLGGGNLICDADEALKYVFNMDTLHSVAMGCKMREELDYNLTVMYGKDPSPDIKAAVKTSPRRLHIEDWCLGCGACVEKCPFGLLTVENGKALLAKSGCVFCGYCGSVCEQFAIKVI